MHNLGKWPGRYRDLGNPVWVPKAGGQQPTCSADPLAGFWLVLVGWGWGLPSVLHHPVAPARAGHSPGRPRCTCITFQTGSLGTPCLWIRDRPLRPRACTAQHHTWPMTQHVFLEHSGHTVLSATLPCSPQWSAVGASPLLRPGKSHPCSAVPDVVHTPLPQTTLPTKFCPAAGGAQCLVGPQLNRPRPSLDPQESRSAIAAARCREAGSSNHLRSAL